MGAAVIAGCNTPPVFEATEHDLNLMELFIQGFAVGRRRSALAARRDARRYVSCLEGGSQLVRILALIADKALCARRQVRT